MHTKVYWSSGYDPGVFSAPETVIAKTLKIKDASVSGLYLKSSGENVAFFIALHCTSKTSKSVTLVRAFIIYK